MVVGLASFGSLDTFSVYNFIFSLYFRLFYYIATLWLVFLLTSVLTLCYSVNTLILPIHIFCFCERSQTVNIFLREDEG